MPTLNEYKNEPGYFIRAWTPETENITYQIRREGTPIVEDYGLKDGEEISWVVIKSLKALALIETKESGIISPNDDFEPDYDQVDVTALSEQEAYDLLEALQSHQEISPDKLEDICEILGVEPPRTELDQLENSIQQEIRELITKDQFPLERTLGGLVPDDILLFVSVNDIQEEVQNGNLGINVFLIDGTENNELAETENNVLVWHWAFVCQEHGIENWEIHFNGDIGWPEKGEVIRQEGQLVPILAKSLEEVGIDSGSPLQSPRPSFVETDEIGV
jgi:hypothetical protein